MKPIITLRQVEHEGLGSLEGIFERAGLPYVYRDMYAGGLDEGFDPAECSGLVVLGGFMNVDETERYPFLVDERQWIRDAIDADVPVLGICLGAQLMASALGAEVRPRPVKEIGWYEIETTPAAGDDRLFRHCGRRPTVFQWHGDGFALPPGAVPLASSPLCPQQAFRYGRTAYALQFHLEMTAATIDRWLNESCNCAELRDVPYISPDEIRRRTPEELPRMLELGEKVFGEFVALCRLNHRDTAEVNDE
jgi:GMP synthase-like glutamine amidotransferase